jgi:hypothetical protein
MFTSFGFLAPKDFQKVLAFKYFGFERQLMKVITEACRAQ